MRAGLSLGMTYGRRWRYIVLPQAPTAHHSAVGNEFIAMLKDSSLVSVIGFEELTRSGQLVIRRNLRDDRNLDGGRAPLPHHDALDLADRPLHGKALPSLRRTLTSRSPELETPARTAGVSLSTIARRKVLRALASRFEAQVNSHFHGAGLNARVRMFHI